MSYIHEALKKVQREKDLRATGFGIIWAKYRYGRRIFKRKWVAAAWLVLVFIGLSSYLWFHSLDHLFSHHEANDAVHQAAVRLPVHLDPGKPSTSQGALKSQYPRARGKATNKAVPSQKEGKKETQKAQQALAKKPAPDKATTLYRKAVALQKEGRLEEAKKLYEAALELTPHLVSALNNFGAIYIKEKKYAAARRILEKAVQIEPGYVDPYYNLACLHALQKDVSRSLSYLKKAASVDEAVRKWARTDKDLENLRGHSEYEKIIRERKNL